MWLVRMVCYDGDMSSGCIVVLYGSAADVGCAVVRWWCGCEAVRARLVLSYYMG